MSPFMKSVLCWVGGGVAGAALAKKHRVKGAVLGALLVGGFGDVLIERNDPNYTGLPPKTN